MAGMTRIAGVTPLLGAMAAAAALAGVAVFSVASAGCAHPGEYVQRDGYVELVGGCVDTEHLPGVPMTTAPPPQAEPASLSQ